MSVNLNDPRLTAYALGELEGQELREMEELVSKSEEARRYVQEVRQTAELLQSELKAEAQPQLQESQRSKVLGKGSAGWRKSFWIPAIGFAVAAAATFVIVLPQMKESMSEDAGTIASVQLDAGAAAPADPTGIPEVAKVESRELNEPSANKLGGLAAPAKDQARLQRAAPKAEAPAGSPAPPPPPAPEEAMAFADASADVSASAGALAEGEAQSAAPAEAATATHLTAQGQGVSGKGYGSAGFGVGGRGRIGGAEAERSERKVVKTKKMAADKRYAMDSEEADESFNTESYSHIQESDFLRVSDQPLSTFSIDVDTASYSLVRRFLNSGSLPPADAVRIEELVNYFPYDYAAPTGDKPFSVKVDQVIAPWQKSHSLVRIGLKGKDLDLRNKPKSNLVFLIDVSGSMVDENKLPLLKSAIRMLVEKLDDNDRVSIVVYAGASGLVLPSTSNKSEILAALEKLEAGGSTNGGQGIELAYKTAQANFIQGGTNRVILATDGDFNVGTTNEGELVRLIEEKAKSKVFLSVLGFGSGNYKDSTMEKLAGKGNGNYAYIDTQTEAKKALVEQIGGTLVTIAKDVKIQVEFNPKFVTAYRLVGYENRALAKEDFNNDAKDAGDIGAGHTVTALYEIVPAGGEVPGAAPAVDTLKYQKAEKATPAPAVNDSKELLTVKIRYKDRQSPQSKLIEVPVDAQTNLKPATGDMAFASSVALFGMVLRDSKWKAQGDLNTVKNLARSGLSGKFSKDPYRREFLTLIDKAQALKKAKGGR